MLAGLLSIFLLAAPPGAGDAKPVSTPSPAAAFEKLKSLAGDWDDYSTKGWAGRVSYALVARGSVLVATSQFEKAHPGETMLTVFHLDGDRLLLTHYCVARNQPRLEATSIEEGLASITFTFRDATNLPSRDKGHLDKAVFRFEDADHFTSRWTWYQDGKESWMEEIRHTRRNPKGGATRR